MSNHEKIQEIIRQKVPATIAIKTNEGALLVIDTQRYFAVELLETACLAASRRRAPKSSLYGPALRLEKSLAASVLILIVMSGCARGIQKQKPTQSSIEQQLRAALCDLERRDFVNAQKKIDAVLKSEPENIYAAKVSLGILARQVKPGDKSAENIALIRKAVAGIQRWIFRQQAILGGAFVVLYEPSGDVPRVQFRPRRADRDSSCDLTDFILNLGKISANCERTKKISVIV